MIICNKCGESNADEERLCLTCGHKLQSLRCQGTDEDAAKPPLLAEERIDYHDLLGREGYFRKHLEAWAYLGVLAAAAAVCQWLGEIWPLVAAIPVLGLIAWLRKL